MGEIQIALIAIALVLSAVFLPMAFFGGSTGVIYRQFSITIVSSMVLSVIVALILSPGADRDPAQAEPRRSDREELARQHGPRSALGSHRVGDGFNRGFAGLGRALPARRRTWSIASGCWPMMIVCG